MAGWIDPITTMSQRRTDTEKWDDGWYAGLGPDHKLAWNYINDKCDGAGVWDCNFKLADMKIGGMRDGFKVDWEGFLREAGYRLMVLANGKWWNTKHISFQIGGGRISLYGPNGTNRPHTFIFKLLRSHGLVAQYAEIEIQRFGRSVLSNVDVREAPVLDRKMPWTERRGLMLKGDAPIPRKALAKGVLAHLNHVAGRRFTQLAEYLGPIEIALRQTRDDSDGIKKMIDRETDKWKGTEFEEYLTPAWLFHKTKWRERYNNSKNDSLTEIK